MRATFVRAVFFVLVSLLGSVSAVSDFKQWKLSNGFTVILDESNAIVVRSAQGAVAWSSMPLPFVTVSAVDFSIQGENGMFQVTQDDFCAAADVGVVQATALPENSGVKFEGSLGSCQAGGSGSSGSNNVTYTLTLETMALSRKQLQLSVAVDAAGACASTPVAGQKTCRIALRSAVPLAHGVHGFGEQYSVWDMRGRIVPLLVSEQGVGRGLQPLSRELDVITHGAAGNWHTTYASLPHYITDGMQSILYNHSRYAEFDLTKPGAIEARVSARPRRPPPCVDAAAIMVSFSFHAHVASIFLSSPFFAALWDRSASLYPQWRYTSRYCRGVHAALRSDGASSRLDPLRFVAASRVARRSTEIAVYFMSFFFPFLIGPIVGYYNGTESVLALHQKFKQLGINITGYWLQDWTGLRVCYTFARLLQHNARSDLESRLSPPLPLLFVFHHLIPFPPLFTVPTTVQKTVTGTRLWWNWEVDDKLYHGWDEMVAQLAEDGTRVSQKKKCTLFNRAMLCR
jgi:hypothetical protein